MIAQELREMADEELLKRLDELYQEQLNLRFQLVSQQLSNTSRVKEVRRDIARVKTLLRERELKAEVQ